MKHSSPIVLASLFLLVSACERTEREPRSQVVLGLGQGKSEANRENRSSRNAPERSEADDKDDDTETRKARVIGSGPPALDDWTATASQLFHAWSKTAPGDLALGCNFDVARCFAVGCAYDAHCVDEAKADAMTVNFYTSQVFREFQGSVFRSAPTVKQNQLAVTWIVERP